MIYKIFLSAFLILSAFSFHAFAQTSATNIEIIITNSNNAAIAGADVVLHNRCTGLERSVITDGSPVSAETIFTTASNALSDLPHRSQSQFSFRRALVIRQI